MSRLLLLNWVVPDQEFSYLLHKLCLILAAFATNTVSGAQHCSFIDWVVKRKLTNHLSLLSAAVSKENGTVWELPVFAVPITALGCSVREKKTLWWEDYLGGGTAKPWGAKCTLTSTSNHNCSHLVPPAVEEHLPSPWPECTNKLCTFQDATVTLLRCLHGTARSLQSQESPSSPFRACSQPCCDPTSCFSARPALPAREPLAHTSSLMWLEPTSQSRHEWLHITPKQGRRESLTFVRKWELPAGG